MKKYKLKEQARQFFDEQLHKEIESIEYWKKKEIPHQLLDEVPIVYIEYGHQENNKDGNGAIVKHLNSWNGDKRVGEFRFTLKVSDIGYVQADRVNISELMDAMQGVTDRFFKDYICECSEV